MTVEALRRAPEARWPTLRRPIPAERSMQAVAYLIVRDRSTAEAPIVPPDDGPQSGLDDGQRERDPSDRDV